MLAAIHHDLVKIAQIHWFLVKQRENIGLISLDRAVFSESFIYSPVLY